MVLRYPKEIELTPPGTWRIRDDGLSLITFPQLSLFGPLEYFDAIPAEGNDNDSFFDSNSSTLRK